MAKTETEIEIKRIEASDDNNRFSDLFLKCFRQQKDASYFKWKYFDNPVGNIIGYQAESKGKIIGSYGLIPEYYIINWEKKKIYQAVDAMVSPRFWGKKIFEQLAQKSQEDVLKEKERTFLFTFPGKLSINEFTNNLGWEIVREKCNYIFVLRQYFQIKHPFLFVSKAKIHNFTKVNKELEDYLNTITPQTPISKFFDANIFQWKVFENPNHNYKVIGIKENEELKGICVYRKDTEKTCEISYVNFSGNSLYKKYLPVFVKHIFDKNQIRYIYTWKPQKGVLADSYRKSGFKVNPFSKGPFRDTYRFIVYGKDILSEIDIKDFDNYEIQPILLD